MTRAAILGANGQIARSLVEHLPHDWELLLFSRNPDNPPKEAAARGATIEGYRALSRARTDVVINASGPGDPGIHRAIGAEIFRITEYLDNCVLDMIADRPETAYINISTGAIYDAEFGDKGCRRGLALDVDDLGSVNPYVLAKFNAEAKHRHMETARIADIRVFGYLSRNIDLHSAFFAAQAIEHLCARRLFRTPASDFVRDYVSPEDLAALIVSLVEHEVPNRAINALSAEPVTKFELLDALRDRFGLAYSVDEGAPERIERPRRLSPNGRDNGFRFSSKFTSLQTVLREAGALYNLYGTASKVSSNGHD